MEAQRLLAEGIAAFHAGQRARARTLFTRLVELDERNELAWLWLSEVVDDPGERGICLENALTINPGNAAARWNLEVMRGVPNSLWPVGAFWLGVSLIFTGAGLAELSQLWTARDLLWLVVPRRGAGVLVTCALLVSGLTNVFIAVQVWLRQPAGFYGSVLFSLALAAIAPSCSLLREPPDYLGGAILAFLPSLIFMLTLLSRPGFESGGRHPHRKE
jgi:hypothetical protein